MPTCDCSGEDKAYVIVNPNSVNRREILSLNPPICHDVKTKGLLINGQPFTGWGEIQSWTTEQQSGSGIEVDWGGGDVDILTGETWDIDNYQKLRFSLLATCFGCRTGYTYWYKSQNGEYSLARGALMNQNACGSGYPYSITTNYGTKNLDFNYDAWARIGGTQCPNVTSSSFQGLDDYDTASWKPGVHHYRVPTYESTRFFYKVITNTGASSEREASSPPTVTALTSDCILTITYTDGKTQALTYPECPTVEPLQCLEVSDQGGVLADICPYNGEAIAFQCDDRQCPPETCCELECGGGRVCCYGPNSGSPIDSFIRRT